MALGRISKEELENIWIRDFWDDIRSSFPTHDDLDPVDFRPYEIMCQITEITDDVKDFLIKLWKQKDENIDLEIVDSIFEDLIHSCMYENILNSDDEACVIRELVGGNFYPYE